MNRLDPQPTEDFFDVLARRYGPASDLACICVVHLLPSTLPFLGALSKLTEVASLLPKPKSMNARVRAQVSQRYDCDELSRDLMQDGLRAVALLENRAAGRRIVLLDVGGYFAPALDLICKNFSGDVVGVVEDTENGLQRYQDLQRLPCPVYSVARSPLKNAEDYLVGCRLSFRRMRCCEQTARLSRVTPHV